MRCSNSRMAPQCGPCREITAATAAIDIAGGEGTPLDQKCDVLCVRGVAIDIDETGLDHRVAGYGYPAVTAEDDIRLEHMVIAEDVLDPTNGNERAERAATAKAIGKIVAPAAEGPS